MRLLPASRRRRRRLLTAAGALAAAGALVLLAVVLLPSTGPPPTVRAPASSVPAPPAPAAERDVPLAAADRRAIDRLLDRFVPAAVERRDPAAAYALAAPSLRAGTSRARWASGDIPVYPYQARGSRFHGWKLDWSHPDDVGLDLLLHPGPGTTTGAILFNVHVRRIGGRWLVSSFVPAAVFSPAGRPARVTAAPDFAPSQVADASAPSRLSPLWLVLPVGILALLAAVPVGIGLRAWRRDRRATREAREWIASGRPDS